MKRSMRRNKPGGDQEKWRKTGKEDRNDRLPLPDHALCCVERRVTWARGGDLAPTADPESYPDATAARGHAPRSADSRKGQRRLRDHLRPRNLCRCKLHQCPIRLPTETSQAERPDG